MGELYKLEFRNGKSYIGITTKTAKRRFDGHKKRAFSEGRKSETILYNAWRKYGEPRLFVLAIIEDEDLSEAEKRSVIAFNTIHPFGYNMTAGGETSPMLSPNISAKSAEKHRGIKPSAETRERMSKAAKNRKASKETRLKMSLSAKNMSAEKRNFVSNSSRNSKKPKGFREKMSAVNATSWAIRNGFEFSFIRPKP